MFYHVLRNTKSFNWGTRDTGKEPGTVAIVIDNFIIAQIDSPLIIAWITQTHLKRRLLNNICVLRHKNRRFK